MVAAAAATSFLSLYGPRARRHGRERGRPDCAGAVSGNA